MFAVIVPVGPSEREIPRLRELLASLSRFEKPNCFIVAIDDSPKPRPIETLWTEYGLEGTVVHNPRQCRHRGLGAGLCPLVVAGLQWVIKNIEVEYALRLDTDSLVISHFHKKLEDHFNANPDCGIVGTYRYFPGGKLRLKAFSPDLYRYSRRLVVFRDSNYLPSVRIRQGFWGLGRKRRELINRAVANGYTPGDHCQGGGYALSSSLLQRLKSDPGFKEVQLWRHHKMAEDFMMTIFCYANGMKVSDLNQHGEVFAVAFKGLPISPAECVAQGYGIVHSVKSYGDMAEDQVRATFQQLLDQESA